VRDFAYHLQKGVWKGQHHSRNYGAGMWLYKDKKDPISARCHMAALIVTAVIVMFG
jgi:hypothetical protein